MTQARSVPALNLLPRWLVQGWPCDSSLSSHYSPNSVTGSELSMWPKMEFFLLIILSEHLRMFHFYGGMLTMTMMNARSYWWPFWLPHGASLPKIRSTQMKVEMRVIKYEKDRFQILSEHLTQNGSELSSWNFQLLELFCSIWVRYITCKLSIINPNNEITQPLPYQ